MLDSSEHHKILVQVGFSKQQKSHYITIRWPEVLGTARISKNLCVLATSLHPPLLIDTSDQPLT